MYEERNFDPFVFEPNVPLEDWTDEYLDEMEGQIAQESDYAKGIEDRFWDILSSQ